MEITVQLGNVQAVVEGATTADIWKQLSAISSAFTGESCGCCSGQGGFGVSYQHSIRQEYDFYELVCQNPSCKAKLKMGQRQDGSGLFPRRTDNERQSLPNNGWEIWQGGGGGGNQQPQQRYEQPPQNQYNQAATQANTPPAPSTPEADIPF